MVYEAYSHSFERSVPALKGLVADTVVLVLTHIVISSTRSQEIVRQTDFLRCGPIMWSKARWCTRRIPTHSKGASPSSRVFLRAQLSECFHIQFFERAVAGDFQADWPLTLWPDNVERDSVVYEAYSHSFG